jgi:hypothetical protein
MQPVDPAMLDFRSSFSALYLYHLAAMQFESIHASYNTTNKGNEATQQQNKEIEGENYFRKS